MRDLSQDWSWLHPGAPQLAQLTVCRYRAFSLRPSLSGRAVKLMIGCTCLEGVVLSLMELRQDIKAEWQRQQTIALTYAGHILVKSTLPPLSTYHMATDLHYKIHTTLVASSAFCDPHSLGSPGMSYVLCMFTKDKLVAAKVCELWWYKFRRLPKTLGRNHKNHLAILANTSIYSPSFHGCWSQSWQLCIPTMFEWRCETCFLFGCISLHFGIKNHCMKDLGTASRGWWMVMTLPCITCSLTIILENRCHIQ